MLACFPFPFLNVVYDSGKGKAIRRLTDHWLLRLKMGKGLTTKGQHREIWGVIDLYPAGGGSSTNYTFVKAHRPVHQKK